MKERDKKIRKIYCTVFLVSVLVFIIGLILGGFDGFNGLFYSDTFTYFTMALPFCLWAWLIIIGLIFVKKDWIVNSIIVICAIPHIINIMVLVGFSNSFVDILQWYLMVLSFGLITF